MSGVLFDLFGTIIPRPSRKIHEILMIDLAAAAGVDSERFIGEWKALNRERIASYGRNTDAFMQYLLSRLGVAPERDVVVSMSRIWYDMTMSHFNFFDDVVLAFRSLREIDIRTGLLTNCGPNVPDIIEGSVIRPHLDSMTFSTMEGFVKPEREIYLRACAKLGTEPHATMFIGDGDSHELPGARNVGMAAVKLDRGPIAGDYRILKDEHWEHTIVDLDDIIELVLDPGPPG
ncbi:MAG: HAD family hydrolase [Candidatus Thermoplasmatota archaeon]|nr:HAD family hydrolase [Candidatus Thermoplasmatota archaeon]